MGSQFHDDEAITRLLPALPAVAPRVLIVDDDAFFVEHLSKLAADAGYMVSSARSGEAALAELHRQFAPIVILDRKMPGMDGLDLCHAIRAETNFPGYVYVILCTGHDSEQEILAGLAAGADDYLSKAVSPAQIVARLATARRIVSLEQSLKAMVEERRRMAMTDVLTGCHNRRYFENQMRRELKRARRVNGPLASHGY